MAHLRARTGDIPGELQFVQVVVRDLHAGYLGIGTFAWPGYLLPIISQVGLPERVCRPLYILVQFANSLLPFVLFVISYSSGRLEHREHF